MTSDRRSLASKHGVSPASTGPLRALQLIETVGTAQPFTIVPIIRALGTAVTPAELMAAKVRWAERAKYTILTQDIPPSFAPYNAVIRVSDRGTEDRQLDYLAQLAFEQEA